MEVIMSDNIKITFEYKKQQTFLDEFEIPKDLTLKSNGMYELIRLLKADSEYQGSQSIALPGEPINTDA